MRWRFCIRLSWREYTLLSSPVMQPSQIYQNPCLSIRATTTLKRPHFVAEKYELCVIEVAVHNLKQETAVLHPARTFLTILQIFVVFEVKYDSQSCSFLRYFTAYLPQNAITTLKTSPIRAQDLSKIRGIYLNVTSQPARH